MIELLSQQVLGDMTATYTPFIPKDASDSLNGPGMPFARNVLDRQALCR